jgi:hypothetical protein
VSQNSGPVITEVKPADLDFSEVGFWPETREFVLVACRRDFVTAPKRWKSAIAWNRHKDCLSGVLAVLTLSLRQATSL